MILAISVLLVLLLAIAMTAAWALDIPDPRYRYRGLLFFVMVISMGVGDTLAVRDFHRTVGKCIKGIYDQGGVKMEPIECIRRIR